MLLGVMSETGQTVVDTPRLAHTTLRVAAVLSSTKPHPRRISRPFFLHSSHLHPAGFERKKWKATISFFGLLPTGRTPP